MDTATAGMIAPASTGRITECGRRFFASSSCCGQRAASPSNARTRSQITQRAIGRGVRLMGSNVGMRARADYQRTICIGQKRSCSSRCLKLSNKKSSLLQRHCRRKSIRSPSPPRSRKRQCPSAHGMMSFCSIHAAGHDLMRNSFRCRSKSRSIQDNQTVRADGDYFYSSRCWGQS